MKAPKHIVKATLLAAMALAPASSAFANPLDNAADESDVRVAGTIQAVGVDTFKLDYGEGAVEIELDDNDPYPETSQLRAGSHVVVEGKVDKDFFHEPRIEAGSVHIPSTGKTITASSEDEEDVANYAAIERKMSNIEGTIKSISGKRFTLQSNQRVTTVDTSEMKNNPLEGRTKRLNKGDTVKILGMKKYDVFEKREFAAKSILKI